jgi:hypothetical protein
MRKKTNPEKYAKLLAQTIIYDLIKNNRFQTIVEYVLLAWKAYPNLKVREMLNAKTIIYLNEREKNEKSNIVKFRSDKLN